MGVTMRLGLYTASLKPGTIVAAVRRRRPGESGTGTATSVNNAYREVLEQAGLVFSGCRPTAARSSSSSCQATCTRFFVATQAHPEFLSPPHPPAPVFSGLIAAALARSRAGETGTRAAATAPNGP